eukprot:GHVP01033336.1.p1 GENE.GHVP01033336.1~~GHVP01033336.1.p1  ORF type:complete len:219 (+),score=25.59 GHVP01033336.1:1951-2607(+)
MLKGDVEKNIYPYIKLMLQGDDISLINSFIFGSEKKRNIELECDMEPMQNSGLRIPLNVGDVHDIVMKEAEIAFLSYMIIKNTPRALIMECSLSTTEKPLLRNIGIIIKANTICLKRSAVYFVSLLENEEFTTTEFLNLLFSRGDIGLRDLEIPEIDEKVAYLRIEMDGLIIKHRSNKETSSAKVNNNLHRPGNSLYRPERNFFLHTPHPQYSISCLT